MESHSKMYASSSNEKSLNSSKAVSDTNELIDKEILDKNIFALQETLKPFLIKFDESVTETRKSQENLNKELNEILGVLEKIKRAERFDDLDESIKSKYKLSGDIATDIELKSRQLLGLKRRLTLVHSILQTVNSRVKKLLLIHNSRLNRL